MCTYTFDCNNIQCDIPTWVQNQVQADCTFDIFRFDLAQPLGKFVSSVSFKLFKVNVPIFGLQTISEAIAGRKMKALFINNYKNMVALQPKWDGITLAESAQMRKGVGVAE